MMGRGSPWGAAGLVMRRSRSMVFGWGRKGKWGGRGRGGGGGGGFCGFGCGNLNVEKILGGG
jgi:hypothetical protein